MADTMDHTHGGAGVPQRTEQVPQFRFAYSLDGGCVRVDRAGTEYLIAAEGVQPRLIADLIEQIDGTKTSAELQTIAARLHPELTEVLVQLDDHSLLDYAPASGTISGIEALFELEDLSNRLLYETVYKNAFWTNLRTLEHVPENVFYGMALENYHFLFRESYFDSPVLSYQGSTRVRLLMNEFYAEEYGHDEILLKALNAVGISRKDAFDCLPLPETMALCNALTYWASTDPLFFFATLGILEGKDVKEGEEDSFLEACTRLNVRPDFVGPVRTHARINRDGHHGDLTRAIFREIECIDGDTFSRMKQQMELFVNMYDRFYAAIWTHYSTAKELVRRAPMPAFPQSSAKTA